MTGLPFMVGDVVTVTGLRGTFKVTGYAKDGSIAVYGGRRGSERFRAFDKSRVRPSLKRVEAKR